MLAATSAVAAGIGVGRQPIGTKGLLRARAPECRRFDGIAVARHLLGRMRVRFAVHPLVPKSGAVRGADVTRVQGIHAQFPFSPAARMIARLTAVRATWIL